MKPKRTQFNTPLFPGHVMVQYGGDPEQATEWFQRYITRKMGKCEVMFGHSDTAKACTWWYPWGPGVLIWFCSKKPNVGTIAHECMHATGYLLEHSGVRFQADKDEPFCYMLQCLVQEIWDNR